MPHCLRWGGMASLLGGLGDRFPQHNRDLPSKAPPLAAGIFTLRCPRGDGKSAFEILIHCPRGDGKSAFEILIHSYPSALPVIPEEKQLRKRRILQRCWCTILKGLAACTNLLQQFD